MVLTITFLTPRIHKKNKKNDLVQRRFCSLLESYGGCKILLQGLR